MVVGMACESGLALGRLRLRQISAQFACLLNLRGDAIGKQSKREIDRTRANLAVRLTTSIFAN